MGMPRQAQIDPIDKAGGMPVNTGASNLENIESIADADEREIARLMQEDANEIAA